MKIVSVRGLPTRFCGRRLVGMRAALAVDPARIAVVVVLLLPDRDTMLDFIDDVATGLESLLSVARAHAHPHRHLADRKIADPMDTGRMLDAEARLGLGDDALAFLDSKRLERLVLQPDDGPAFIVIPNPTLEGAVAAGDRVCKLHPGGHCVDCLPSEAEGAQGFGWHGQPPAT